VAHLALRLFEGLRAEHGLGDVERDLLHFSALLHDVGSVVGYDGHAEHSAYIIRNGNLRGLHADEVEKVALIARYHGKARPRRSRDEQYAALDRVARRTVQWLCAILRVAEGLDRSHYQLVRDVSVHRRGDRWTLLATTTRDAQLELWAGRRRVDALERLLGAEVRIGIASVGEAVRGAGGVSAGRRRPGREAAAEAPSAARAARAPGAKPPPPGPPGGPVRRRSAPAATAAPAGRRGREPRPATSARRAARQKAPEPAAAGRPRVIPLRTATS
jgi:hypothetical protein